jgi:hypothetical protein
VDPGYKACGADLTEPFVNIAGEYMVETRSVGGFGLKLLPYHNDAGEYCPTGAVCSLPIPPPSNYYIVTLQGQPCGGQGCLARPYVGYLPQGTLVSITNKSNVILSLLRPGYNSDQCYTNYSSATVPLDPGSRTTDLGSIGVYPNRAVVACASNSSQNWTILVEVK